MYEIAIFSAFISLIVTLIYIEQAWTHKNRNDLVFGSFAFAMIMHNLNLYTWLNLPLNDPLVPVLRATDYFYGIPLLSLGVYFLHVSAKARVVKPNAWASRIIVLIFSTSLPVISTLYLTIDPEIARRAAVVFLVPLFAGLPIYYFNHFRKHPYRTLKPEYERGYRVIFLGYFCMVLGTGILAGVLRQIELGIAFEAISVILIGLGGYIIGTVTYAGLYERLDIHLIIVDSQGRIVDSNLRSEPSTMHKLALAIVAYLLDSIEKVFLSGNGLTIPNVRIDPLGFTQRFKVDILPHELGTDGNPISVVIAISDVSRALEDLESEQLSEILTRYKGEREKASFYLDLLSHDMANIIQGMLLGVETAFHQLKRNMNVLDGLTIVNDEIDRSMILLKETKVMVRANETSPVLNDSDLIKYLEDAMLDIHELYPRYNITFNAHFPPHNYVIQAEDMLKYAFFSVFRFIVDNVGSSKIRLVVRVGQENDRPSSVFVEIACDDFRMPAQDLSGLFDWHSRNPSGGVGLPLANVLVRRYNGTITVSDSPNKGRNGGASFTLEFPVRI